MDKSKAHTMSIDDILVSVRNVINEKDNEDDSPYEELELTNIKEEKPSEESILSQKAREENRKILQNFVDIAKNASQHVKTSHSHHISEDLIKSQIKEWLDANLPAIVKQIVSEEVKKLVADVNQKSK